MKIIFLVFITFVIMQWYFKMKQGQKLRKRYVNFLKHGDVLVERNKGIISGKIIMFQLDKSANIKDCLFLSGSTFWSDWKKCDDLINKNLLTIKQEEVNQYKRKKKQIILKAIQTNKKNNKE